MDDIAFEVLSENLNQVDAIRPTGKDPNNFVHCLYVVWTKIVEKKSLLKTPILAMSRRRHQQTGQTIQFDDQLQQEVGPHGETPVSRLSIWQRNWPATQRLLCSWTGAI